MILTIIDIFNKLGIVDKIIFTGFVILVIAFVLTMYISNIKYTWDRENCNEYLKDCQNDEKFEKIEQDKNNNDKFTRR